MYLQVKRTLWQFTPAQWDKDQWHPLLGPWRFIQVLTLCIVFLTVELNTFFLKFCLWVPPRNPVIVYRLILWWLIAIPTIREYNSYLQDQYSLHPSLPFCISQWTTYALLFFLKKSFFWINVPFLQTSSEEGWRLLLAICCYLYRGTSHLHQIWTWYVPMHSCWSA